MDPDTLEQVWIKTMVTGTLDMRSYSTDTGVVVRTI